MIYEHSTPVIYSTIRDAIQMSKDCVSQCLELRSYEARAIVREFGGCDKALELFKIRRGDNCSYTNVVLAEEIIVHFLEQQDIEDQLVSDEDEDDE